MDNLVAEGLPRTKAGRSYDYGSDAIVWYYERKLERERGKRPALKESQERFEAARAKKAELELDIMQRKYVAIEDVRRIWGQFLDKLRAILLNMAATLAPRVVGVKTVRQAMAQLDEGAREILSLLQSVADEYGASGTTKPAKRSPRKRAGKRNPGKAQAAS